MSYKYTLSSLEMFVSNLYTILVGTYSSVIIDVHCCYLNILCYEVV